MSSNTLHQLYIEHEGKVSDKWSLYLSEYDRLFAGYRDRSVRLLEIGIQNGGSLELWAKYFSNAEALIGCDINTDCVRLAFDDPRIAIVIGDANDRDTAERLLDRCPQFDIIIDDGSHRSSDIVKSFARYFSRLADDGLFIAEDLHCSYWNEFEGGLFDPYSSISFFKRLADVINHEHWGVAKVPTDILQGIAAKFGCEFDAESLALVHSVEFINSMCVVRKAPALENRLGHRVISGLLELTVQGHKNLNGAVYQLDPIFDQSDNRWTTRKIPPDEALPQTERDLADVQHQVAELKQQSAELTRVITGLERQNERLDAVIESMRNSTSWRLTAPLRFAMETAKRFGRCIAPSRLGRQLLLAAVSVDSEVRTRHAADAPHHWRLRAALVQWGHIFYRRHMKGSGLGRMIGAQILKRGLVSTTELQISALSHDSRTVHHSTVATTEVNTAVPGFHLSPPLNLDISDALAVRPHINVLLPSLRLKHMSGGPNTALLLAALLAERGERVRLIACDGPSEGEESLLLPHMDQLLQRPVARDRIELVDGFDRSRPIAVGVNDIYLATAWWTAQIAKYALATTVHKTFIYLIQDFEPILHEGSTFQARALETYGLPHIPVINTRLLLDHLQREGTGCFADAAFVERALCFEPALDRGRYFADPGKSGISGSRKKSLLFYARPTVARRNLFELGVVALRQAVAAGVIDKDHWEVWAMGENLAPVALGGDFFLNPLPWMSFDAYAERVRTADLMLSLMLSPHPSYPPLEMAASGKLVVTNSFSVKTAQRLRDFSPNIIVAEPSAESIAVALENAAGRINAGLPSYDPTGSVPLLPRDWDESLRGVVAELLRRIEDLRAKPAVSDMPLAAGYPAAPKTAYEQYRKACLARRRADDGYRQETGLLSFITAAYNTDPVFLDELAHSVLRQDGGMHFEWLILDNGSTSEETVAVLRRIASCPQVRVERVERNLGIVGGMRYCLERATGRYVLPLDSDDLIEPDCVHVLTRFILDNDYPPLIYTDEDKLSAGRFGSPYFKPDWDPVLFAHSCYIAHLCAIDRLRALELGLYTDPGAEGCHDWDSFLRFSRAGHQPRHVAEVLYSWRIHEGSTSGNIASKAYIAESHRHTLEGFLNHAEVPDIELVNSPLFNYNVDWWFRRKRDNPWSITAVTIGGSHASREPHDAVSESLLLDPAGGIDALADLAASFDNETLIHLCWEGVVAQDDEWRWDAMALFELFPDTVMVGGLLHDGTQVLDGPRVLGFGDGFECPDRGRPLTDPGYGAKIWKPHTTAALPAVHCVIRADFLKRCMRELSEEAVPFEMLGPWLGALALEGGQRVVYSPFMRARADSNPIDVVASDDSGHFLSRFWALIGNDRFYSSRLGLARDKAYTEVDPAENQRHLQGLQRRLLPYERWLAMRLRRRNAAYPAPVASASIALLTTVYEGTSMPLLDALAESVVCQTMRPAQWVIVAHGPVTEENLEYMRKHAQSWHAELVVDPQPLGVMGAMRRAIEHASAEYVVPLDADDLVTPDALQVICNVIDKRDRPDLVYSDEDMVVDGRATAPYLRAAFDPVLNLDSSYVWHLCAIRREAALALGLYSDLAATWCHDWDSIMRIANAGGRIEHVPEVLYHWRQHAGSTTNNERGDPRSLISVCHILEQQIVRSPSPKRFHVAEWPENRGARELYIARRAEDLPRFLWAGDGNDDVPDDQEAVIVHAAAGVLVDSERTILEVARLLDLHPRLAAIGGLVKNASGMVVDSCYQFNRFGTLECPWHGQSPSHVGTYALAQKTQSVAATGSALAFFRLSALRRAGLWPRVPGDAGAPLKATALCGRLRALGWAIAFSPLVQARAGSGYRAEAPRLRTAAGAAGPQGTLVRYGAACEFRM